MCGSAPKPKKVEEKPPQYMRNPWLDGLSIGGLSGIRTGRNALRVDLGGTNTASGVGLGGRPTTPAAPATGAYPAPASLGAGRNPLSMLSFAGSGTLGALALSRTAKR